MKTGRSCFNLAASLVLIAVMSTRIFGATAAAIDKSRTATLAGVVVENGSGEPVGFVNILLKEINRSVTSRETGQFILSDLSPTDVTLQTFRIGYKNISVPLRLTPGDTLEIVLVLDNTPIHMGGVVIERSRSDNKSLVEPDLLYSDKKLFQNLGQTIAQTIDYEPGISLRSMGPAPARPVLRGLGGDRLMLLEDNEQTGDLSASSTDHAVVIEPMTAERIEVIRGPEALVYGSNTLGGVVNVVRGYVPNSRKTVLSGTASLQGESVNTARSGGMELTLPLGPVAVRVDGAYRKADDVHTPLGILRNTGIETKNAAAGIGLAREWGFVGGAASRYLSDYGIPPDPNGGHPSGVNIKIDRQHSEVKGEYALEKTMLQSIEMSYRRSIYFHQEFESSGRLGVEYGVVSNNFQLTSRLRNRGFLKNGVIGVRLGGRDYASGGLTFSPAALESSAAGFYYQEAHLGSILLHGALRYDYKTIKPNEERFSYKVGYIRQRSFMDYSAAFSPHWQISNAMTVSATYMRTFRAPTTEELFSEGPHLASYSYEVGNAELDKENGQGIELNFDYKIGETLVHLALFQNDIHNYTFPANTGEKSWQRADLFIYKYVGMDARMRGTEISFHLPLHKRLHAAGSISYVHGQLVDSGRPIPYMPPLEGKVNLGYEMGNLSISAAARAASQQIRVGEFESPTDGYVVFDLLAQYMISTNRHLHSFSFTLENLTDSVYRKHLNRVRELMPEPGRNFRLLYKIFI